MPPLPVSRMEAHFTVPSSSSRSDAGFLPYFDSVKNENTADASTALAQFQNKKPCWADPLSPSGYVVPLGFLNEAGVQTDDPAFVAGQPTVVRAVYAQGICDFGATYIDARTYPGLQDAFSGCVHESDCGVAYSKHHSL